MNQIEQFYSLIKESVKNYPVCNPGDNNGLIPQTFVVLEQKADLNAPSFGKTHADIELPYFYSRIWEDLKHPENVVFNYPAVILFEIEANIDGMFTNKKTEVKHKFELAVIDRYNENPAKNNDGSSGRVKNQIYKDTEYILLTILDYIKKSNTNLDGDLEYNYKGVLTDPFHKNLVADNPNIPLYRFEGVAASRMYGTVTTLVITVTNCPTYPEC